MDVVGEAASGPEALHLVRTRAVDVLLLDMGMPEMTGVDVARTIQQERLPVRVLALSAYDDASYVSGLLQSGASGYITKEKPVEMIIEAVRAVARGEGRWFVQPVASGHDAPPLSEREKAVLALMAQGRSNAEIAEALFISENTVRNHLASVYGKVGVTTSREAIAWAWRHGIATGL